jgi:hypothetical protein
MIFARIDAVVTWVYAVGFGLPAIPIAIYHLNTGRLPMFLNLFPMYGGRWSGRFSPTVFAALLVAFFLILLVTAFAAWLVWQGLRVGAVLSLALLAVEVVFWIGFDLPIPWVVGIARVVLLLLAWNSLGTRSAAA